MSIDIYNGQHCDMSDLEICGIYCLWHKQTLVYIGQSQSIIERIFKHKYDKEFDGFTCFKCDKEELNEVESRLILEHQPIYNKSVPVNSDYISYNQIKKESNLNLWDIKGYVDKKRLNPIAFRNTFYLTSSEVEAMEKSI